MELPNEIIIEILKNLNLIELIYLTLINTRFKKLIRTVAWDHFIVCLKKLETIKYVINTYKFKKYDFHCFKVNDDEVVKLLTKCHTLNLSNCNKITDAS